MTRPEIIRADTIDLQDRIAPSAQDHSHAKATAAPKPQQTSSSYLAPSDNSHHISSHQSETIRGVAAETAQDRRLSWTDSNFNDIQLYGSDLAVDIANSLNLQSTLESANDNMTTRQQQDALAVAQNGGLSADNSEEDMEDIDDGLDDDDMMDKISSSPSIEDGGYPTFLDAPSRSASLETACPAHDTARTRRGLHVCAVTTAAEPSMAQPVLHEIANPLQVLGGLGSWYSCKASCAKPPALDVDEADPGTRRNSPLIDATNTGAGVTAAGLGDCRHNRSYTMANINETVTSLAGTPRSRREEFFDDDDEMTVPYIESDEEGSDAGSSALYVETDIDFDFVYALHTFQATVEGQANATKGDTMVLLDDSNSYWWLVRVVKDSSIGYLPAEHIETPSERLARLNKHRNIDLSATMLGDQADKTKNSLMTAMRRRKAKTVAFAAPTYVDYDVDYSSDEEDLEAEYFAQQQAQQQTQQQQDESKEDAQEASQAQATSQISVGLDGDDESAKVEPLKPRAPKEAGQAGAGQDEADDGDVNKDLTRSSEDIFEASKSETPGPKKTKDGTVRDSFFKDDTVETKKITLTPNLLRDDSAPRTSSESKDAAAKQRPSIDRLDKDINAMLVKDDKKKKDKKEKDKKQGGFRSLFSRKDKKRGDADDDESIGKRSMDTTGGYSEKDGDYDDMDDEAVLEKTASPPAAAAAAVVVAPVVAPLVTSGPYRNPSKLQKQQPLGRIQEVSPTRKTQKDGTVRIIDPEAAEEDDMSPREPTSATSYKAPSVVSRSESSSSSRPQMAAKAPVRTALDEFDSDDEVDVRGPAQPQQQQQQQKQQQWQQQQQQQQNGLQKTPSNASFNAGQQAQAAPRSIMTNGSAQRTIERLSESPVQVSPVNAHNPPALMVDTSSQEEEDEMDRSSPISSPSPELVESESRDRSGNRHYAEDSITTSTSAATTANTATWNDTSLRAFFDSGADVRDLLAVVYDKSDVEPAGPDHPVAGSLFKEQNAKLAEITTQLDNMLGDWLARKQRLRGAM